MDLNFSLHWVKKLSDSEEESIERKILIKEKKITDY